MTLGTIATEDEEKKEKKGFFFSKKKKNKEKEVEAPKPVPHTAFPSAPSEISSSDFNSHMTPEDILRGFRQHQVRHNKREARSTQR